jgi:hypothetical protein
MWTDILSEAEQVLEARGAEYGPAGPSLAALATRWSHTLGTPVSPAQAALCLIDLKLVRLAHNPGHRDSLVDVIGYAALAAEVQT